MEKLKVDIDNCTDCILHSLKVNTKDKSKGYGKLTGYYKDSFKNKIMMCGLNPSHRRFPDIYQAFGGEVEHKGTGRQFIQLLKELNLLNKIYLTNIIKCSEDNNKPLMTHFNKCIRHFKRELDLVKPSVILAFGKDTYLFLKYAGINATYIHHPVYYSVYKKISKESYMTEILNSIK